MCVCAAARYFVVDVDMHQIEMEELHYILHNVVLHDEPEEKVLLG